MREKKQGFTLVEIMIVVAIIGLLASIAIPSFVKARDKSQQSVCINNLRQIDYAKEQMAMDYKLKDGDVYQSEDMVAYIKGGKHYCPSGGTINPGLIGTTPTCTITTPTIHALP